ncbi:trypsin-like cysteine/serine peptidase domain-containing protein [Hypoxylon rubiginosum]|uniref:Trypsin-like cysteine/serine peptidase domain-containing protein n=1 Tax=Hypoxylon rubiginosum TaxID=110542 RepID=A0ACC0D849_9PEZI|nr:trypsin-like cysteine/serine peptidase domain-containing protein [Hypoxylon rubiginosum]
METVDFMDVLFTPGSSNYNICSFMRRYQLLAAVALKHENEVAEIVQEVENAIQQLRSTTSVAVTKDHAEVAVVCPLSNGAAEGISHAIHMAPVKTDGLTISVVHHAIYESTYALHTSLTLLNIALSDLCRLPLNITGEIMMPPTTVGWRLEPKKAEEGPLEESDDEWHTDEDFFDGHEMKPIRDEDLERFRAIVKLNIKSRTKNRVIVGSHGTGWLLDAVTVVTAGHCVLKRGKRLVSVDVVIGHGTKNPMSRPGTYAIAQWRWFRDYETANDLALIRIARADGEQGLKWRPMPTKGGLKIFAIGYPSYASHKLRLKNSKNSYMQKSEDEVQVKEAVVKEVLRHTASTWNGSSGCPILDGNDCVVAVHSGRRNLGDLRYNAASVLDRAWNNVDSMKRILDSFESGQNDANEMTQGNMVYRLGNDGAMLFGMGHL